MEEVSSLLYIVSKHALDNASSESVKFKKEIGKQQCEAFVTEHLKTGYASLYDEIKNRCNFSVQKRYRYIKRTRRKPSACILTDGIMLTFL